MKFIRYWLFDRYTPDQRIEMSESLAYHRRIDRSTGWNERGYIDIAAPKVPAGDDRPRPAFHQSYGAACNVPSAT